MYKNISDQREIRLIEKTITKDSNVVDIGANIGFYTKLLSKKVGDNGNVYAFEPSEENYEKLKRNTSHLENVTITKAAVGNTNNKLKLYLSDDLNVDHRTYPTEDWRRTVEVDCIRLDDFFQKNRKIDFIKLDVQGFEYQAILGMQEIIEENPGVRILFEFWPFGLNQARSDPRKLIEVLKGWGFRLHLLSKEGLIDYPADPRIEDKRMYFTLFAAR